MWLAKPLFGKVIQPCFGQGHPALLPAMSSVYRCRTPLDQISVRRRQRMRVMVVDDNVDATASLGQLLELMGHEVKLALDGPTALEAARQFRPDVLLLDLGMPGMSGY